MPCRQGFPVRPRPANRCPPTLSNLVLLVDLCSPTPGADLWTPTPAKPCPGPTNRVMSRSHPVRGVGPSVRGCFRVSLSPCLHERQPLTVGSHEPGSHDDLCVPTAPAPTVLRGGSRDVVHVDTPRKDGSGRDDRPRVVAGLLGRPTTFGSSDPVKERVD